MGIRLKKCDGSWYSISVNLPCPDNYHYAGIRTSQCGCQDLICTNKGKCENRDDCSIGNVPDVKDFCLKENQTP